MIFPILMYSCENETNKKVLRIDVFGLRPYHPERARSRLISEAKQGRAWLVLGWENWCFWTVVPKKTLESPLDCKEIQPVHPKGNQSCIFFGRTDVEAEAPILWPPDVKSWLTGKDPDAGKDWGREKKGTTEDEMAGWQSLLNGHRALLSHRKLWETAKDREA